jgi:hypothetical protein
MIAYKCTMGNYRAAFLAEYGRNRAIKRIEDLEKSTICQRCASELEKQGVKVYHITRTIIYFRERDERERERRQQLREAGLRRIEQYEAEQERDTTKRVQATLAAVNGHRPTTKMVDRKRNKRLADQELRSRMRGASGGGGNNRRKKMVK